MESRWCPECSVVASGMFCKFCGRPTAKMYLVCPNCEQETSVIGKFCGGCGRPIQEEIREHLEKTRKEVRGDGVAVRNGEGEGDERHLQI